MCPRLDAVIAIQGFTTKYEVLLSLIKFESSLSVQDVHSQGEVIACLEKGLVREAEEQPGAHAIKEECKKAIMRVAELSSDDFHLDRYLYFACRDDRERFCENVRIVSFSFRQLFHLFRLRWRPR